MKISNILSKITFTSTPSVNRNGNHVYEALASQSISLESVIPGYIIAPNERVAHLEIGVGPTERDCILDSYTISHLQGNGIASALYAYVVQVRGSIRTDVRFQSPSAKKLWEYLEQNPQFVIEKINFYKRLSIR